MNKSLNFHMYCSGIGCHVKESVTLVKMSSTHDIILLPGQKMDVFAVGGGGGASNYYSGSSGFFAKYIREIENSTKKIKLSIELGAGGSGGYGGGSSGGSTIGLDGGVTTVSINGAVVLRAPGGGGSGRPGWSGGTNSPPAGFNGASGSSFSGNGNGAELPELCGDVVLTPGAAGSSSDGPGAGGVILDGQKPTRLDSRDGEGYGAGGGEDNRDGYPGAVLLAVCSTTFYTGTASMTSSGRPCQMWSSTTPHNHSYTSVGHHNYCRNPNGASGGVWCYTTDPDKEWEYCAVPKCYSGVFL